MKLNELIGPALNWAVASIEKRKKDQIVVSLGTVSILRECWGNYIFRCEFSTNWSQGGPIIERESIIITPCESMDEWSAALMFKQGVETHYGPTPLIAAMRCYVASKLGDEIEIPKQLSEGFVPSVSENKTPSVMVD